MTQAAILKVTANGTTTSPVTRGAGQGFDAGFPRSLGSTISWSSDTTPVIPEVSPQVAFDNLFRRHVGPEARQRAEKHQSVLDYVRDEIADQAIDFARDVEGLPGSESRSRRQNRRRVDKRREVGRNGEARGTSEMSFGCH